MSRTSQRTSSISYLYVPVTNSLIRLSSLPPSQFSAPADPTGGIWPLQPLHADSGPPLAGSQPATETKVSHCPSRLAQCRLVNTVTLQLPCLLPPHTPFLPPPTFPSSTLLTHLLPSLPSLLSSEFLTEKLSEEAASSVFSPMPSPHYREVASLILNK